jgi:hypothetical protein
MSRIHEVAGSNGIDFRTFRRLSGKGQAALLGQVLYTSPTDRTAYADGIVTAAQDVAPVVRTRREDKVARRVANVNSLTTGRVHGRTLREGQPARNRAQR